MDAENPSFVGEAVCASEADVDALDADDGDPDAVHAEAETQADYTHADPDGAVHVDPDGAVHADVATSDEE